MVWEAGRRAAENWRQIYRIADWLMIALALQGMWILGTLAGLVLFGYAPSSTALAACWRSVVGRSSDDSTEGGLWRLFWQTWRRELGRSQGVVLIPTLTLWTITFWSLRTGSLPVAAVGLLIGCALLLTLAYLPVAAAAKPERDVVTCWRAGVALAWIRPAATLGMALGVVALAVASLTFSAIILPLFVPTLPILAAVWSSERTFARLASPRKSAFPAINRDVPRTSKG